MGQNPTAKKFSLPDYPPWGLWHKTLKEITMTEIEKNGCNCEGEHDHDCECGDDCDCETNIITLDMEDGTQKDFSILNIIEHDGKHYVALAEVGSDEYDIMRFVEVDESIELSIIEDDAEYNAVADIFDELFTAEVEDLDLLDGDK